MAKTAAPKPSIFPAVLALLVLVLFGYLLFTDLEPSHTEHTVNPPIEIIDPQMPLTVIESTSPPLTSDEITAKEAAAFVDALASPQQASDAITVTEEMDQFVRHDSVILLPNLEHRITTIEELAADQNITADTPLTLHYTTKETVTTTLAELSAKIDDHTVTITVIDEDGNTLSKPLADLISEHQDNLSAPIVTIQEQKHSLQITAGELLKSDISTSQTVVATINHGVQELSIKDIIQSGELPDNALFYLHRVTERDRQGLWGIIQTGLIDKFREGLHIEGIQRNKDLVQVTIPADADEKLPSGLSSFLGKILNNKVDTSYIYNFSTHTMGYNPNIIHPGQQLILIHFSPSELTQIYQFFSAKRNQGIETFAITD